VTNFPNSVIQLFYHVGFEDVDTASRTNAL